MRRSIDAARQSWETQKRGWSLLKSLRPGALDLGRVRLIREASPERIMQTGALEQIIAELGLNDEAMDEMPADLHPACGEGLRIWQYPIQFAPYLRCLAQLQVRSYLEIGIRHGGSYVLTVETLDRFRELDWAVGVDVIACPSMSDYSRINARSTFAQVNTNSDDFAALCRKLGKVDLVFIDSHHEEDQCRREVAALRPIASMLAMHDITNVGCPGVGRVWRELCADDEYQCTEFIDQYDGLGPFMGIGLAIRADRNAGGIEGGLP